MSPRSFYIIPHDMFCFASRLLFLQAASPPPVLLQTSMIYLKWLHSVPLCE